VFEEQADAVRAMVLHRDHQGSDALIILDVGIRAVLKQEAHRRNRYGIWIGVS